MDLETVDWYTSMPSLSSAPIMYSVSSLNNTFRSVDVPVASAAMSKARFVIDLDPGTWMRASKGLAGARGISIGAAVLDTMVTSR